MTRCTSRGNQMSDHHSNPVLSLRILVTFGVHRSHSFVFGVGKDWSKKNKKRVDARQTRKQAVRIARIQGVLIISLNYDKPASSQPAVRGLNRGSTEGPRCNQRVGRNNLSSLDPWTRLLGAAVLNGFFCISLSSFERSAGLRAPTVSSRC